MLRLASGLCAGVRTLSLEPGIGNPSTEPALRGTEVWGALDPTVWVRKASYLMQELGSLSTLPYADPEISTLPLTLQKVSQPPLPWFTFLGGACCEAAVHRKARQSVEVAGKAGVAAETYVCLRPKQSRLSVP